MKSIYNVIIIFFQIGRASMSYSQEIPTVGFFPESFPRDPVDVNSFLEHILLGQVLEPLVETNADGIIEPGAAETWTITDGGKKIQFRIKKDLKFSNGASVTSQDFRYSLERHMRSSQSQSKTYMDLIAEIKTPESHVLEIYLHRPYVAIFKALSRDQLGVLPSGWTFNPKSEEPFIGTGPYRIIKNSGQWFLEENSFYRNKNNVSIKKWKVLLVNQKKDFPTPSLMPFELPNPADDSELKKPSKSSDLIKERLVQFSQSSAWWYPHGKYFLDRQRREIAMTVLNEIFELRLKSIPLRRATGIIPEGIIGHLEELPLGAYKVVKTRPSKGLPVVTIAAFPREYKILNDVHDIQEIENRFKIKINLIETDAVKLKELVRIKPDILTFSFSGGFHDPEGFLTVITSVLASNLQTIFGNLYPLYLSASSEQDWSKRGDKYKKLNLALSSEMHMSPGWKNEGFRIRRSHLHFNANNLRYTPKLIDYSFERRPDEY